MTDIENSTVKVRTLIVVCAAIVLSGGALLITATESWVGVNNKLNQVIQNQDTISKQMAVKDEADKALALQVITLSQATGALSKRMDDYRPFKWPVTMMMEYNDELQQLNPGLKTPDVHAIDQKILPYTP